MYGKNVKYFIFIFCLGLFQVIAANEREKEWRLVRKDGGVELWQLKSDAKVVGTLRSKKRKKSLDAVMTPSKAFFENLVRDKQETLALMGITEWKALEHTWKKEGNFYQLEIQGSYLNFKRQKITFVEHHYFSSQHTHQILVTYPENKKPNTATITEFIKSNGKILLNK